MKHYIVVTDTNSRQYIFEIKDDAITVNKQVLNKEQVTQELMQELLTNPQLSIENATFNTAHLVALQAQSIEDGAF